MVTMEQIKKLQEWYSLKHDGFAISDSSALAILRDTDYWGYSTFIAAHDILTGNDPQ